MVDALRLRKAFARSLAVNEVSFHVKRGEVLALLGPNGAGKTTTLRLLLNILLPDAGEVLYDGNPFSPDVRNTLGYLPEERGLYKKSRLLDTIVYFACLRGMGKSVAREKALVWLGRFGLGGEENTRIEELSKGNQQKAQFIVAVVHDPWFVALDEPFAGLDPLNQVVMQETIAGLRAAGKAVILSTHQMEYAEKLSDTLCLIHEGRALLTGSVAEIKKGRASRLLRIEFSESGSLPPVIPGVLSVRYFPGGAECELDSGVSMGPVVAGIAQRVDLRKCEMVDQSLHSIFMEVVHREGRPDRVGS
jgi:ABC-2 type transport system ATP-binding protein